MLAVGRALKPHGVRGELKALAYSDEPHPFDGIGSVLCAGVRREIERVRHVEGRAFILKLKGVDDRADAEKLRNLELFAMRSDLPALEPGRHYVADVLGLSVVYAGEILGKIVEILPGRGADVAVCEGANGRFSFPWLKELDVEIVPESGEFVVRSAKFLEVACHDF